MVLGSGYWHSPIWPKICFLFVACLLLFLLFFIPVTLVLLFTKMSYRLNFIVRYLKPFIDVYQAPYKSTSRYLSGIALIVRVVALSVTSLSTSRVVAINLMLAFIYLSYIGLHQPFKHQVNHYIYVSYLFNLGCVPILIVYHNYDFSSKYYTVALNILVFIALLEFTIIMIYYFCKNVLKWNVSASHFRLLIQSIKNKVILREDHSLQENDEEIQAVMDYAEFREKQLEMEL